MTERQAGLLRDLRALLGPDGLLTGAPALTVYARDASHLRWGRPLAVALPRHVGDLAPLLELCARAGVPVVPRGAGTGLSGGAVPPDGALVLGTARLGASGSPDPVAAAVRAEPGVLNAELSRRLAPAGLHFAPDPSSQAAATIGGNIAENAGGPHCLRLGVTSHHLRALDWCDADGRAWTTGVPVAVSRGVDLRGLLCGSEGTLGVVTGAWLQTTPVPPAVATLLAAFPRLEAATAAVPRLLQAGLLPVAIEIIDRPMLLTVEAAFAFGLPTDVEAVMIAELAGAPTAISGQAARLEELLCEAGARDVRRAADERERLELWRCRKRAFGAVGRLSPNYVSMDVVVPLGELPGLVREIQDLRTRSGLEIATAFHAGDGNLHPAVHYDERLPGDAERAHAVADAIMRAALRRRGSVTGEHGVGLEKRHALPWQMDATTAALQRAIKAAFDPAGRLNPGKALPAVTDVGEFALPPPVPGSVAFAWDDLTVTAPATTSLAELQVAALARGLWLPLGLPGADPDDIDVAAAIDRLLTGPSLLPRSTARDLLLELWAETGDGRSFHVGAPVFKNVAGYDLVRLLCGADGRLARLHAATFALRPAPAEAWAWRLDWSAPDGEVAALAPLLATLSGGGDGLAGCQVVGQWDGQAARHFGAVLLAAGSAADHAPLAAALAAAAPAARLVPLDRVPFARAGTLVDAGAFPPWARQRADWTALQPVPGQGAAALPPGIRRLIWQGPLGVVWTPDPVAAPVGWHADQVREGGRPLALPTPVPGVPRALLRRLKHVFDPEGRLGGPTWLTGGGHD